MKGTVSTESLVLENKEVTLVSVTGSDNGFGICDTTTDLRDGTKETFYVGQEAVINIAQKNSNDSYSNKLIWQISSTEKCGDFQRRISRAVEEFYENGKNFTNALSGVFETLKNGVYAVYQTEMLPTDGAGNFFWNGYSVSHELNGSSKYSTVCRKQRNVSPAFLVPTETIANFSESSLSNEKAKLDKEPSYGGIAFHLSGMFCALLSNHHTAAAALMNGQKLNCIVIEPLRNVFFKNEIITKEGEEPSMELCDYIYSPFVKIPVYKIPQSILENFFMTRSSDKTKYYDYIRTNSDRPSKIKTGKRAVPRVILEKCEQTPDSEMLQSAAFIDKLTDEELEALLNGETTLNDRIIVNTNYYSSVCIACNYLQYTNFDKFLGFAISIMKNETLTAMHQFVAGRLMPIMNPSVKDMFETIKNSDNAVYEPVIPLAEKYLRRYESYMAKLEEEKNKPERKIDAVAVFKRDAEIEINALEMAKKLQTISKSGKK